MLTCFALKKTLSSLAALGLALIGIPHLIFCLYPFSDNCYTEKTTLSLDGLVLGGYVLILNLIELYNLILTKVALTKHHFLSALNVIFLVCE